MKKSTEFFRRSTIWPAKRSEYPHFLFIWSMIPITYWFEVWVVLPSLFPTFSITYWSLFLISHFILHNVVGNLWGILAVDTSIRGRIMPSADEPGALFCSVCETITPPRSHHCPDCKTCILKYDHHCAFSSCCIGHYNHRFFIMFVFYLLFATLVCLPFNAYFLWDVLYSSGLSIMFKILFPLVAALIDFSPLSINMEQIYILISSINVGGLVFSTFFFYFHIDLILHGNVVYEMRHCIKTYNLGKENNIRMVLGERWYLTWISPFLTSPLPCDGITFPVSKNE